MTAPISAAPPMRCWQRPWLGVLSRSLAAIFGGYALGASASALMSLALPMARGQAVVTGMLAAIVIWACAALWAFAARTVLEAWIGIAAPTLVMLPVIWMLRGAA